MPGVEFLAFEVIFAPFTVSQSKKMLREGLQANRLKIESSQGDMIVNDRIAFFGTQNTVDLRSRWRDVTIILPELLEQGVAISMHNLTPWPYFGFVLVRIGLKTKCVRGCRLQGAVSQQEQGE